MENLAANVLRVNMLASISILLVLLLSRLVKKKYSSQWKYVMWLLIGMFLLFPVRTMNENAPLMFRFEKQNSILSEETAANTRTVSSTEEEKTLFPVPAILRVFGMLWLVAAVVLLAVKGILYQASITGLRRWSYPEPDVGTLAIYQSVYKKMDIKNPPRLVVSAKLQGPLLAGLFHTCLYLPEISYTRQELKLIFRHELSHYQYKDLWYKMFLYVVGTIYWFNPFLQLMVKESEKDVEYICDSRVVSRCSADGRMIYNRLLLKTAASQQNFHYLTASLNDHTSAFKERILNIMRAKTLKKGILPLILCAALLFSANALLGCSVDVPSEDKKEEVKLPEESDNKKDNKEDNKKDNKKDDKKGNKKDNTVAMEKNEPKKPKTQEQQENVSVKDNQKPNSQQTEMAESAEEQNRSYRREEVVENEVVENEIAENEAFAETEEREGIAEVPENKAENEEYYVAERPVELYEGN